MEMRLPRLPPLDKLFKGNLLTCIHAPVRCIHGRSVIRITLVHEVLDEGSDIELLILGHLRDLLGDLVN